VELPVRWRYKLDRWRSELAAKFRREPTQPRPRLCPACGNLVGAGAGRCHQCGANMSYSVAAASRSIGRLLPQTSPVSYGILSLCCVLYGVSLLASMHLSGGLEAPTGGLGAIMNIGGISGQILLRMVESLPLPYNLAQPWRLVTAIFLHGGLLHIGFNMWVLMDVAPIIEDLYGSARFLFIFIVTGAFGYIVSSTFGNVSVGASGSLLGLIGVLLALTLGRRSASMRQLRSQLISWLVYIAVLGLIMRGIDNYAHLGGFVSGFALGKVMIDRQPADLIERRRAFALGWTAGLVVAASFGFMLFYYFSSAAVGSS
jgi:membrane associated rhomboid family serine protease